MESYHSNAIYSHQSTIILITRINKTIWSLNTIKYLLVQNKYYVGYGCIWNNYKKLIESAVKVPYSIQPIVRLLMA